ncbi:MAG: chemotaxis protein CheW [Leptospirales bacterium]|nr:chemotaxis protein CheW [Leptospirales bacterium]
MSVSDSRLAGQFLTLRIAGRLCAMPIAAVLEIIERASLTGIPASPPFVAGMMDMRGRPVLVLDPAQRFFGAPTMPTRASCIVLLQEGMTPGKTLCGLLVDSVHDVISLQDTSPAELPDMGYSAQLQFLEGVATIGGEVIFVLKPEAIWTREEIQALDLPRD